MWKEIYNEYEDIQQMQLILEAFFENPEVAPEKMKKY
jgi:hypothetical protein